jgi:CheY-like chemotaxis protein
LLVDDEEAFGRMFSMMLEKFDYSVVYVESSIEALELFRNAPKNFNLVITDQAMPGIVCTDLAIAMACIRPDILIILCSGYVSNLDVRQEYKDNMMREIITKPIMKIKLEALLCKF